ncbi:hypothetical protein IT575_12215 [bacterium]|nr:hypothetical protein [bacterium]
MTPTQGFTAAAALELASAQPRKQGRLFIKRPGDSAFTEYTPGDWDREAPSDGPVRFSCLLPDPGQAFDDETDSGNQIQLLTHVLWFELVGTEYECKLYGPLVSLVASPGRVDLTAYDWSILFNLASARAELEPGSVEVVDANSYRELSVLDETRFGSFWAFTPNGSGTDPAFDEETQTRRRAWQRTDWRLFYDNSGDQEQEVPEAVYQINHTAGGVTILEDTAGREYWIRDVRAYLESAATHVDTVPCDFSRLAEQVLTFAELGGLAAEVGELDIEDTGLDMAGSFTFPPEPGLSGTPADFIRLIQTRVASNFRAIYDSQPLVFDFTARTITSPGKWRWFAGIQKPRGEKDYSLSAQGQWRKERNIDQLASAVEVTGFTDRPGNLLAGGNGITLSWTNLLPSAHWCTFDGANNPVNVGFNDALAALWDGDDSKGLIVASLGGPGLNEWVEAASATLSEPVRVEEVVAKLAGTKNRNPNNQYGNFEGFWPGVQIMGRLAGGAWAPTLPRYVDRPGAVAKASGDQLNRQYVDEIKLVFKTFKGGISNQNDPWIGAMELALFFNIHFLVKLEFQDSDPDGVFEYTNNQRHLIIASSSVADSFTIAGDWRNRFAPLVCLLAQDTSAGVNDGKYKVLSSSYDSGDDETTILVDRPVPGASASGTIKVVVDSYRPGLVARTVRGGDIPYQLIHREDVGDRFNQYLAIDVATQLLDEKSRVLDTYTWNGPADSRIDRYQTVEVPDGWRSGSEGFYVEYCSAAWRSPRRPGDAASFTSTVKGRDYLAGGLGDE